MKKGLILCVAVLTAGFLQAQPFTSKSYPTGVYIFCGKELPKTFEYVIERKGADDREYQVIASVKAPSSEAECKGRLMSLPALMAARTRIDSMTLSRVWKQVSRNSLLDSLYGLAPDPRYQYTVGCSFFDEGVAAGTYTYRISKKDRRDNLSAVREERVIYPSRPYAGAARAVRFKPEENSVIIHYGITDTLSTAGLTVYRSRHKENAFTEIPAQVSFLVMKGQTVAQVVDATAAKDVTYSYVAVPFDGLGNLGRPADTLNVYNMVKAGDIGMVQSFSVTAQEEKRGMDISWKLLSDAGLTSIEIFRGMKYDGTFERIASVSPGDTSYFDGDKNLLPATSYFYYVVANASYGRSYPSGRSPAILKGSNPNVLPPQHIEVSRSGNIVSLRFLKAEPDTRGYYVYRAKGYAGELKQLQRMLLTADSSNVYQDTLPLSDQPEIWSYAVADVNTSYNISPVSERVNVQTSGTLPVVAGVEALPDNGSVFLTWKNAALVNPALSAYRVYRSAVNQDGSSAQGSSVLAVVDRGSNSFTDSTVQEGLRYRYQVQALGVSQDAGAMSQWASINMGSGLPLPPGQVLAFPSDKKAMIKWDLPAGEEISKIRVYRSMPGTPSVLLKELGGNVSSYEDSTIQPGKTYYYMITSVNKGNRESEMTDAVAVKLR